MNVRSEIVDHLRFELRMKTTGIYLYSQFGSPLFPPFPIVQLLSFHAPTVKLTAGACPLHGFSLITNRPTGPINHTAQSL